MSWTEIWSPESMFLRRAHNFLSGKMGYYAYDGENFKSSLAKKTSQVVNPGTSFIVFLQEALVLSTQCGAFWARSTEPSVISGN